MKIDYNEIATYDLSKRNEEVKLLIEKFKYLRNNYKNNTPRPPTVIKKGKTITTKYQLPWEKELQYFVWDLIRDYTSTKNYAHSLCQEIEKYYSELARCNQAYSPSVIMEHNLFMHCDWVYDHGFVCEGNKNKVTQINEFGKKRKLDEILWLIVKAKEFRSFMVYIEIILSFALNKIKREIKKKQETIILFHPHRTKIILAYC